MNCKWDASTIKESQKMEAEFGHFIDVWIEYDTTEGAFRRLQEISFSLGKIYKKNERHTSHLYLHLHTMYICLIL